MNPDSLLFGLINAAAFMLSVGFLVYICFIVIPFLRHRPSQPGDDREFSWHFVVPCRDEEQVIERTVARLRSDFPAGHVWCIDDASEDRTPQILRRLSQQDAFVHVVTRRLPDARLGKGPALNSAWEALRDWLGLGVDAERIIVGVVDADGYLDPNCLKVVSGAAYFGDPTISAVQIQVRVNNDESWNDETWAAEKPSLMSRLIVRMQDLEFTTVIAAIQMLRQNLGSVGMGGNGQFTRLSALNLIAAEQGYPWRDALLEDFELGLHVLLTGGRNEYCHDTWVLQQGPATFWRLVRQRSRWGQGMMQCRRYLPEVVASRRVSTGAAVEIVYFLLLPWVQVVGDLVYLGALAALAYGAVTNASGPLMWLGDAGAWQIIPMFVIFGLAPLAIWGPIYRRRISPELSRTQAWALGLMNWPYILVHHCAVWWAFGRTLRSRHDWKKTERLATTVAGAPDSFAEELEPLLAMEPAPLHLTPLHLVPPRPNPPAPAPAGAHRRGPKVRIHGRPVRAESGSSLPRPRPPTGGGAVVEGRMQVGAGRVPGTSARLVRKSPVTGSDETGPGPTRRAERPYRGDGPPPPRSAPPPSRRRTESPSGGAPGRPVAPVAR